MMLRRILRAASVIMLMLIAERLLSPLGLGWIAYVIGAVAFVVLGWLTWRRADPVDRHVGRWLSDGLDAPKRSTAITEARSTLERVQIKRGKLWQARTLRIRLALAELLSASGELEEAGHILDQAPDVSNPHHAAALQIAKATLALRQGRQLEAEGLLETAPTHGSPLLAAQRSLLQIATFLQTGEAELALKLVNETRSQCADFPSLRLQLRLYHAAALSKLGQEQEASEIVADLDDSALTSAKVYGLPPIRKLLRASA